MNSYTSTDSFHMNRTHHAFMGVPSYCMDQHNLVAKSLRDLKYSANNNWHIKEKPPLKQYAPPMTQLLSTLVENQTQTNTDKTKIVPTKMDVLFGRGGLTTNHQGNTNFRLMVEAEKHLYRSLGDKKELKNGFSKMIMARVFSGGGRFLKKDVASGNWVEAEPRAIRRKCSQALRERPLKSKRMPQFQGPRWIDSK